METTGGYFYQQAGNSSRFVAIEFLSQIANERTCIRNIRMYVYIYEDLDLDDYGGSRFARLTRVVNV